MVLEKADSTPKHKIDSRKASKESQNQDAASVIDALKASPQVKSISSKEQVDKTASNKTSGNSANDLSPKNATTSLPQKRDQHAIDPQDSPLVKKVKPVEADSVSKLELVVSEASVEPKKLEKNAEKLENSAENPIPAPSSEKTPASSADHISVPSPSSRETIRLPDLVSNQAYSSVSSEELERMLNGVDCKNKLTLPQDKRGSGTPERKLTKDDRAEKESPTTRAQPSTGGLPISTGNALLVSPTRDNSASSSNPNNKCLSPSNVIFVQSRSPRAKPPTGGQLLSGGADSSQATITVANEDNASKQIEQTLPPIGPATKIQLVSKERAKDTVTRDMPVDANVKGKANTPVSPLPSPSKEKAQPHVQHAATPGTQQPNIVFKPSPPPTPKEVPKVASQEKPVDTAAVQPTKALEKSVTLSRNLPPVSPTKSDKETPVNGNKAANPKLQGLISNVIKIKRNENGQFFIKSAATPSTSKSSEKAGAKILVLPPPPENETSNQQPSVQKTPTSVGKGSSGPNTKEIPQHHSTQENSTQETVLHDVLDDMIGAVIEGESREKSNEAGAVQTVKDTLPTKQDAEKEIEDKIPSSPKVPMASNSGEMEKTAPPTTKTPEKSNQNPEIAAEDEGNSRNVTENVQEPKDKPLVTPNENSPEESADLNNTERETSESTNVVEESMEREEPKIRTRGRKRKSSEMKEGNVTKRTTRLSRLNLTEKRDRVVVKYKLLDSGKMNLEDCKSAENLKKSKSEPAKKQKPKLRPPPTAKIFTSEEGSSFQVKLRELREQRRTESAARQQTITKPTEPPPILDKSHAEFAVSALFFKNNENPRAKEGEDMTYEPHIKVDDEPVDEPGPSRIREEAENIQVSVEPNEKQVSGEPEKNQAALLLEENKICEEPNKNQTPEEVLSDCQALNEPENSSSTSESSPEPARLKSGSNQQKRRWAKRRRKKKIVKPTSSKRKWSNARRLKHMLTIAKRKNLGHISKAERELSKLGHVVINVDKDKRAAEVEQASEVACEKEFCKLGCVCQSLKGSMRDEFHCGKEDCLFGCKCAQAGASNCVNDPRVRDKIRDRAPAEKEFINTVIKGSELLVMAERGKRERKVPQRLVCDFVTGEEIESSCSKRARLDDADYPTVRKRLLDEYWEKQLDDRVSNLQSPDILEEPPDGTIVHSHDGEDDGTAIRVHIDGIECVQRQISQFVPRVSPEKEHEEEHEVEPMEHSSDEDGTPKIISIASIAPEEFDKQGASSSRELEIIDEVCIELPTSYAIIEARRNAKIRAKTMLTRFKDSVISAGGFIPSKLYNDKFCTVSWESFIRRLKARSLFVWVETNDMSNQQIALITDYNGPPFVNFVNVFEKAKKEPTNVILEKLNLLPSSPPVPFILWCNGHNWEILGKLSQCCSTLVNPPEPYKPEELLPENIDSKWLSISAVHGNAFSRLLVGTDVVVDYSFICKLKTMSWEQKRPLVATIPKSKKRKFNAPFGFYSPCSKSMVFLGPYDMDETILDMRLVPPNEGFGDPLKMLQVVRLRQLPQVRCDISEVGIWTCPIERVQDVPYCRFYDNGMLIKLPMERNELLIFESAIGVELFLKNITRDLYKTDVEWTKKERGQYKSTSRVMEEFENFEYQLGLKILDEEIASGLSELPNSSNSLAPSEQPEQSGLEHALAICEKYKETQRCPPSPEVQLVYEDSDDEDDQDILGLLERDSDDYKLEMRNAFLDAECLYPAMGDEKFKRTRLVREMANEVMTLQKTAAALEKEKKELEKIKVAHIKKFELLPRDDRMKIVKAIKKLSNAILANKKHMIELEDKSKSKNEDVPVASTSTQNIPVASTSRQTVPAACTSRQTVPAASTSRQTVPAASTSRQTVPAASTNRQTVPAASTSRQAVPAASTRQTVPAASTSRQTVPAASTNRQTVPAASTNRQTVPAASTSRQTVPAASTSRQTVPAASTNRQAVPAASNSRQAVPVASTSRQAVPAASTSRQAVPVASTSRQTVPIASSSKQTVPGNTSLPGSSKNVAFTGPGTTKVTTLVMPVTSSKDPSQEVARLTQCPAPAGAKYIKLNIKELEKIKNMIATAPPRSKVTINTQGNQVKIVHTTRSNVAETISSNVKTPTPWVKRIPSTGRTNEDSSKELEDNTLDDMPILTPNCNLEENAAAGPMQPRDEGRITIQNPLCSFPNSK
ncbi:Hypothetical predicted protein [Cloeon dipterum]|uniref:MGA conserved domain-containing protein n=1 Tax=Cloeon dipterum TaxID=197152 RepID=A0A8S1BT97_9INSE|nr:Hypothetical predicted protein [Cloeon dipterum]